MVTQYYSFHHLQVLAIISFTFSPLHRYVVFVTFKLSHTLSLIHKPKHLVCHPHACLNAHRHASIHTDKTHTMHGSTPQSLPRQTCRCICFIMACYYWKPYTWNSAEDLYFDEGAFTGLDAVGRHNRQLDTAAEAPWIDVERFHHKTVCLVDQCDL